MAVGGQACGAPEMIKIRKLICSHALAFSLRFVHGDDVVDSDDDGYHDDDGSDADDNGDDDGGHHRNHCNHHDRQSL